MCGIFGVVSKNRIDIPIKELTDTLAHRGPDNSGYYIEDNAALGHRRLSIIDLAGGHQPVSNEDGTKCIVFNGEIYNFRELRDRLISSGHKFSTLSDTETILHAYEEWGEGCLVHLRGMFAFAIWDKIDKCLFIARDRLGIKPLFYAEWNGKFYFSSEMKAILADPDFPRDMDEMALACYFTLSYIPAPLTIFSKIRKLLPGHTITWCDGKIKFSKYWDLHFAPDRGKDESYFIKGFMEILEESVKGHLISEVPLGAFLSGGVDSSTIVAMMSKADPSAVNTFTMGFGGNKGGYLDERGFAASVAERYATHHRDYEVMPSPEGLLDKIVRAFDEPFADDSVIPSYFVCKIARENVTVALSGLGGDELFAGYERYLGFRLRSYYSRIPLFVRENVFLRLTDALPERSDGHYTVNHIKRFVRSGSLPPDHGYFGYLNLLKPSIRESFFADSGRFQKHFDACSDLVRGHFNSTNVEDGDDSLDRAQYCDMKTYLPEDILALTDRISMQHSLEVRVPFLDHKLVEFCATIPSDIRMKTLKKKYLLKKAVSGLLPPEVINHRKQGFVGPMSNWLKTDMKAFVLETLSDGNLSRHGLINKKTIDRVVNEHITGKEIHDKTIWSLIVFQRWFELYAPATIG